METEVSSALVAELLAVAEAGHPLEVCGLLMGEGDRISGVRPCVNVHPCPHTHFEIDPRALIAAHRSAREGGPQVVGYFHSHPVGPPQPSATDRAEATGDGRVWAIIGEGTVGWWRDEIEGFAPLSYAASDG
jgi:proteasome lid subunit RPN8/RPN11